MIITFSGWSFEVYLISVYFSFPFLFIYQNTHKTHTLRRCLFVCVGVVGWMGLTNIQPTVTSLRHSGHVTGCVKR